MIGMTLTAMMAAAVLNGATCAPADMGFYSKTMAVVELDARVDAVTAVDFSGNEFAWFGIEDWLTGDTASVLLCDNGTPEIYDDIVIDATYSGWITGPWGFDIDGNIVAFFPAE